MLRPAFAGAVTTSSATLWPILPPSIPLIVYGSVTSVSIVQVLVAGIVPAIPCIGAQIVGAWLAKDLVEACLAAEFSNEDFRRRARKLAEMDAGR